ncbi:hypothetical protein ACMZ6Y_04115, partial [Streptococcus pluranimalium]
GEQSTLLVTLVCVVILVAAAALSKMKLFKNNKGAFGSVDRSQKSWIVITNFFLFTKSQENRPDMQKYIEIVLIFQIFTVIFRKK